MKTKSEIIKGQLMTSKLTPLQWNGILRSMDEFAKQEAIEFAGWIKDFYDWMYSNKTGKWGWGNDCLTTEQLYEMYAAEPAQIAKK